MSIIAKRRVTPRPGETIEIESFVARIVRVVSKILMKDTLDLKAIDALSAYNVKL